MFTVNLSEETLANLQDQTFDPVWDATDRLDAMALSYDCA